jgi:general secretion pathway protein A
MDYFGLLNLNKEPFSNSPDPDFFFHSRQHTDCLQKLELSLLLRRGLNVIIGDVGTGKTTLCRQLIRRFSRKKEMETHLILDPFFNDSNEFLATVAKLFSGKKPAQGANDWQLKEYIKQYLFRQGVDQEKTPILIIDEGQKTPAFCLEILREFLNYETNDRKLLQIVIFAQREFEGTIRKYPNFADRINLYHLLKPLSFRDTRQMIKFRLEKSSGTHDRLDLFTLPGLFVVYRATGGYPRKIINLCHQCILAMIIQNRRKVGYFLARSSARRVFARQPQNFKKLAASVAAAVIVLAVLLAFLAPERMKTWLPVELPQFQSIFSSDSPPPTASASRQPQPDSAKAGLALTPKSENIEAARTTISPPPAHAAQPAATVKAEPAANPPMGAPQSVSVEQPAEASKTKVPSDTAEESQAAGPAETVEVKAQNESNVGAAPSPAIASVQERPLKQTESVQPATKPPYSEMLGQIKIRRNETLSKVIHWVYGDFNLRYFQKFITANPGIKDPDRVEIGQKINLPAIPATIKKAMPNAWWIKVDEKDNLEAAFNVLRARPDDSPALHLISYWHPETGIRFALVIKKVFSDKTTAQNHLENISPEMYPTVEITSLWDEDSVYFSDPFLGKKLS